MGVRNDDLAERVRKIRVEVFGDNGVAILCQAMHITPQTWEHFEHGDTIPAWLILYFIEIAGVEPHWLLTGDGDRYRVRPDNSSARVSRFS
jgi:hypothetical protein